MALLKIARLGYPVLRQKALPISLDALASPAIQTFIDDMIDTMRDGDGVGRRVRLGGRERPAREHRVRQGGPYEIRSA